MIMNMTIGKKLGFGFAFLVLLMGIVIWVGIVSLKGMHEGLDRIVNVNNFREQLASDARNNVSTIAMAIRDQLLNKEQSVRQEAQRRLQAAREKYIDDLKKITELTNSQDVKGQEILARVTSGCPREGYGQQGTGSDQDQS